MRLVDSKKLRKQSARSVFFKRNFEAFVLLGIILIFFLKATNYLHTDFFRPSHIFNSAFTKAQTSVTAVKGLSFLNDCPDGKVKIALPDGYICRETTQASVYQKIYDTYPLHGNGREVIYPSLDSGNIQSADELLNNNVVIKRFATYSIGHDPTWQEDPYNDRYWRFNYYSMRPVSDLLYAYQKTGQQKYLDKLLLLTNSFIDTGSKQVHSWDDYHAVAFRTMILTNIWWKLRQDNVLSISDSTKILTALQGHGNFLADRNHYEPEHNHGTNEGAALNLLAVSLPDLPGADDWRKISVSRINSSLDGLVDSDGVLIENSPYYHFYTLQKYWDLYEYAKAQHEELGADFQSKLDKMINYATYILHPDLSMPLLGASLKSKINAHAEYAKMAKENPQFAYVLSQGKKGKEPGNLNQYFKTAGQTVMRSGWGLNETFADQTQLTFDVGPYRTTHSDLDALSFTLFGNGTDLLPDAGLYTYTPSAMRNYFHGTSAHNTVVVDGKDQFQGTAYAKDLVQANGIVQQSAQHQLYSGVTHERSIAMLDKKHVVVVDKLVSDKPHTYEQKFHLFPGAQLSKNGLTVIGSGSSDNQRITITQLITDGISESEVINQTTPKPDGICSQEYGKYLPCWAVSYTQNTTTAKYVTLLTIGPEDPDFSLTYDAQSDSLHLKSKANNATFTLGQTKSIPSTAKATQPKAPTPQTNDIPAFDTYKNWVSSVPGAMSPGKENNANLEANVSKANEVTLTNNSVKLDLSHKNITIKLKVKDRANLSKFYLAFSNNNWKSSVSDDLLNAYRVDYEGEWLNISLGKSELRNRNGHWELSGRGFDWAKIDGARIVLKGATAETSKVMVGELALLDEQDSGKVVIVFDDGYDSILPAADYLHQKGLKANVAVISKYVAIPAQGHLNKEDLLHLQNGYGWNMVNHTSLHQDALQEYYQKNNLEGYERDVLTGAKFLKDNGLNTAPNWFVYPHGATNYSLKQVIAKYYKFARTTINDTEVYPFTDPYGVKTMSVQNSQELGEDTSTIPTTPDQVAKAVSDAKKYKTTLFLTFHRIHSKPSDRPGYSLADFKKVVDNLKAQDIEVATLSQLDKDNGISSNSISFKEGTPAQMTMKIQLNRSLIAWPGYILNNVTDKLSSAYRKI